MKVSIIIPVLNSHKAVRRQVRYFRNLNLPDDVEIIIVDDGSSPPLDFLYSYGLRNLTVHATNDKRPWTQGIARNIGASLAKGEYLFMTDIDHIISVEAIHAVREFNEDKMVFARRFAVLDVRGRLRQDPAILFAYGVSEQHYHKYGTRIFVKHGNTFALRKSAFFTMGRYKESKCVAMMHQPRRLGEDCYFNKTWEQHVGLGIFKLETFGPPIYMFPVGRYHKNGENNPMGLFHSLSYEPVIQPMLE